MPESSWACRQRHAPHNHPNHTPDAQEAGQGGMCSTVPAMMALLASTLGLAESSSASVTLYWLAMT